MVLGRIRTQLNTSGYDLIRAKRQGRTDDILISCTRHHNTQRETARSWTHAHTNQLLPLTGLDYAANQTAILTASRAPYFDVMVMKTRAATHEAVRLQLAHSGIPIHTTCLRLTNLLETRKTFESQPI